MLLKTTDTPRRWFSGKKRICKKYSFLATEPNLKWLLSLRLGDYIGSCSGYNVKIAKVEYHWNYPHARVSGRRLNQLVLDDILFVDDTGRHHYASGPGCVDRPYSLEQIHAGIKGWFSEENIALGWVSRDRFEIVQKRFAEGLPFVDEHGVLLNGIFPE